MFDKKHRTITSLKQIFEYVIDGIQTTPTTTTNVIKSVQAVQNEIGYNGLQSGQQEDAATVYNLINVVFEEELFEKYGLTVKQQMYEPTDISEFFISPVNLPQNNNNQLSNIISNNVNMKTENVASQKYIVFANSVSSNKFDIITIDGNQFSPIGIVQHLGGSSSAGSYGGHYIYYSIKTSNLFNDSSVSKLQGNELQTTRARCVVLYERVDIQPQSSSTTGSGNSSTSGNIKPSSVAAGPLSSIISGNAQPSSTIGNKQIDLGSDTSDDESNTTNLIKLTSSKITRSKGTTVRGNATVRGQPKGK